MSSTHVPPRFVVGVTGASGAAYATRVIELLARADMEVHLVLTPYGRRLLADELGLRRVDPDALSGGRGRLVTVHRDGDVGAPIASGSFLHRGMIVVPASSNTLAAIAGGLGDNLVQRAAAVTLKERRRLVIAHRETPLSLIDIENMERVTRAGAIVAPLAPGFYTLPRSIDDLVDFMAARLLDLLGVAHDLAVRWVGSVPPAMREAPIEDA
jgi:4-hydroxy-3-polyprenylbenzoate decarboxylase